MPKIIYVPQGYSAKFMNATQQYNIDGLYTDGFSTCNIIACIGKGKLVLMHVDIQTSPEKVQEQIEWVGNPSQVIIVLRKEEQCSGEHVKQQLLKHFQTNKLSIQIQEKLMDKEHDGIYISLKTHKQYDIHPNIQKFPCGQRPEGLIHHPQEQEFLAVQKIEQIIGIRAKFATKESRVKEFCIFDGRAWEPLGENELTIDQSHLLTQEEMQSFAKGDSYIFILKKLCDIASKVKEVVPISGDLEDLVMPVAMYLEGYLNQYDHSILLKRNLLEMINSKLYKPQSVEDQNFKEQLNAILKKADDVYSEITDLMNQYQQKAPQTEFKGLVIDELRAFSKHYQERKYYHDMQQTYSKIKQQAENFHKRAVQAYSAKNYESAAALFLEEIKIRTYCSLKDNPNLATAYYNAGKRLYQIEQYEAAQFFLNISLILRENYTQPRPLQIQIENTQNALKECNIKLEEKISKQKAPNHTI